LLPSPYKRVDQEETGGGMVPSSGPVVGDQRKKPKSRTSGGGIKEM